MTHSPRPPRKTLLGPFLRRILSERKLSERAASGLLGCSGPWINLIVHGRATFPPDRIASWCDTLQLNAVDADDFAFYAYLTHLPDEGVDAVLRRTTSDYTCIDNSREQLTSLAHLAHQSAETELLKSKLAKANSRLEKIRRMTSED